MTSLIGQLRVTLGLDTAAFESGATKATLRSKALGGQIDTLGGRVGSLGKVLVGAATAFIGVNLISTLKNLAAEGLEYASSLQEQAQKLGVLASEMQEYHYAASQFGISTAEMDQGLSQLTKRIGQAAQGAKAPKAAFDELGISIRDTNGHLLTAGNAMPLIAGALAKIPDPAQRAALEVALFGKSGQALDPLMTQGAEGVNKLRSAAHELGIVLDDEVIANADDAADSIGKMNQVLKAQISTFVAANAKEIAALATALLALASSALKALNDYMKFRNALTKRDMQYKASDEFIDKSKDPRLDRTPTARQHTKDYARKLIDDRLGISSSSTSYLGGLFTVKSATKKGNLFGDNVLPGSNKFAGFAPGLGGNGGLDLLKQSPLINLLSPENSEALREMREQLEGIGDANRRTTESMRASWQQTANVLIAAVDRIGSAFRGGSFLDKIASMVELGLQIKGTFFSKSTPNYTKPLQNFMKPPGRAAGGPVLAKRMYMVGERGPELFMSGQSGHIVPNHALGGGSTRIEVVPSRYFDVIVNEQIRAAAPAIASAGAMGGEARVMYRQTRRLG